MACKKKTFLDPNQIIDSSPHFIQDMIQRVECMLQACKLQRRTNQKNTRSYQQLKGSLQNLLNLLYKAESLSTSSAVEQYLAYLKSLRAEFSATGGDTSWICAEAISILDVLKAYVVSEVKGAKPETAPRKFIDESADKNYKQFYDFSHANFPPSNLFAFPLANGNSNLPSKDQVNVFSFVLVISCLVNIE